MTATSLFPKPAGRTSMRPCATESPLWPSIRGSGCCPRPCGADCLGHGSQQVARINVVSPQFPGAEKLGESFSMLEEWFSLMRFAKDLHVVLVQDCAGMDKKAAADRRCYDRPPFPCTWARMHGKGRVFYTSLGHREDVWSSKIFEQILLGGLSWALGRLEADITPNLDQVAPQANEFMKPVEDSSSLEILAQ